MHIARGSFFMSDPLYSVLIPYNHPDLEYIRIDLFTDIDTKEAVVLMHDLDLSNSEWLLAKEVFILHTTP